MNSVHIAVFKTALESTEKGQALILYELNARMGITQSCQWVGRGTTIVRQKYILKPPKEVYNVRVAVFSGHLPCVANHRQQFKWKGTVFSVFSQSRPRRGCVPRL